MRTKRALSIFLAVAMIAVVFTAVPTNATGITVTMNNPEQYNTAGNTLITDYSNNRVIEVDTSSNIIWQVTGLNSPHDAERLANGNTLIVEQNPYNPGNVMEIDSSGIIVWQYNTGLYFPNDTERLANGNTLISDEGNDRVIEVTPSKTIVWNKNTGLSHPKDVERLANGNTLIADLNSNSVMEVAPDYSVVWQTLYWGGISLQDCERLDNGNTLITGAAGFNRVREIDSSFNIIKDIMAGTWVADAERLPNGNTLIADGSGVNRVYEKDSSGTIVWEATGLSMNWPYDVERIEGVPTPEDQLQDALTGLGDAKLGDNDKIDNKLDKAIDHLQKSLNIDPKNPGEPWKDKDLWLDEETLDPKEGKHVLSEWGKVAKELNKLIKDNDKGKLVVPESILQLCQDNIDILVEMAEQFATDAYEEAEAIGGDEPWENELEKSKKEFDKAQEALDHLDKDGNPDPKYDKAIDHYKKAWEHAQKALKHALL